MSMTRKGSESTKGASTDGRSDKRVGDAAAVAAEGAAKAAAAFATSARAAATTVRALNTTATAIRLSIAQITGDASTARQGAVLREVEDAIDATSGCAAETKVEAGIAESAAEAAATAATAARFAVGDNPGQAAISADTAVENACSAEAASGNAEKHKTAAQKAVKRLTALAKVARQSWNPFDPNSVVIAGIDTTPAKSNPPAISAEFRKESWET